MPVLSVTTSFAIAAELISAHHEAIYSSYHGRTQFISGMSSLNSFCPEKLNSRQLNAHQERQSSRGCTEDFSACAHDSGETCELLQTNHCVTSDGGVCRRCLPFSF